MDLEVKMVDQLLQAINGLAHDLEVDEGISYGEAAMSLREIQISLRQLLLTGAHSPNADIRRCSVYGLGKIGEREDVGAFIDSLNDSDAVVRAWAVAGLARFAEASEIRYLISSLGDSDSFVYYNTVLALRKFQNDLIVWPLVEALRSSDTLVRQRAAKLLASLKDPRAVDALIFAFADEASAVRYEVVEALGQIADARASRILLCALNDEDRDVRLAAIKGLQKIGDEQAIEPLVRIILTSEEQRNYAMETLMAICGPQAVLPVYEALREIDLQAQRIAHALSRGTVGHQRFPSLWDWEPAAVEN